jgi:putative oxidoreductase
MSFINEYAPLLLRVCLVILFPFSALDKIRNWSSAMRQAAHLPTPQLMLLLSICVELAAPVCIVTGWHDRLAALVLAGFCVLTAVLFHRFWRDPKFWKFQEGEGLQHFWDFLKNFGLVGGLGLIVLGPRTLSLTEALAHPLSSTVVSGTHAGEARSAD